MTNLLLHLGRHVALDNLQCEFGLCRQQLPTVADGETPLSQELTNLIDGAIRAVRTGGFENFSGWWRGMFLVFSSLQLSGGLRFKLGGFELWLSLGIGILR